PQQIVAGEGLAQVSDASQIRAICAEVLAENPEQVASYKSGKTSLIGWFVGQAMRKSGGKADPQRVRALFEELLG
ncbi:MAG: Asp-tRNA(Asn)/Glu-tRNA(Gln) amidotransferase GatCAB subunit B, partial [Anaerolineae bacterium]|nr:Asp-tRNA(Asn)/Glu-tRNA(Gln) amidotransferase GatCAB subunit B [Anaerolineae bacterium]